MIYATLPSGLVVREARSEDAADMEAVQRACYPTLSEAEIITAAHFANHIRLFPEGQVVIEYNGQVIASASAIRYHYADKHHTFLEISDNLWFGTHEPDGEWLYGMDMGVAPDYRGKGLARQMYNARHQVCLRLGLKGQIIVGMLSGYQTYNSQYDDQYTIEQYYEKVKNGEVFDPTVSVQERNGFTITSLITEYLDDPCCGNAGAFLRRSV
ncbi:MAG TPA: hypothetical protein DIW24_09670 [Bacteroidetes bacterium]|nr:hypothetical protein [Bacteroidota bacterium]